MQIAALFVKMAILNNCAYPHTHVQDSILQNFHLPQQDFCKPSLRDQCILIIMNSTKVQNPRRKMQVAKDSSGVERVLSNGMCGFLYTPCYATALYPLVLNGL